MILVDFASKETMQVLKVADTVDVETLSLPGERRSLTASDLVGLKGFGPAVSF